MLLRWTAPASEDLTRIARYIGRDNPTAALQVAKTLYDGCMSLADQPYRGRYGSKPGTRELVFPGLPYIAVYRVTSDVVTVLRIYHGAQQHL